MNLRLCKPRYCLLVSLLMGLALATPTSQAQTYNVVYVAPGDNGVSNPIGVIAQGRDGNMYSTSNTGGTFYGTIFKFSATGALNVVNDIGYFPSSGLTLGTDGNLYGIDQDGGVAGNCGLASGGQVYKVTPTGTVTVLHNFIGTGDGCTPQSAPLQAANGTFYGTTLGGGTGNGTAYSVTPSGTFVNLHSFTGTDGEQPSAPLIQGTDGNFYGETSYGGTSGDGVIFKMSPAGAVTVLHNFTGAPDGSGGCCGLVQASDGNFYGVASAGGTFYGVVFKMTPSGVFTVLHTFQNGPADGSTPAAALVQATDGKLYGITGSGGATGGGTIFSITTTGTFSLLYSFVNGDASGYNPSGPLRQNTNGTFYGNAYYGGATSTCNCGVLYSFNVGLGPSATLVSTSGKETMSIGILGQGFSNSSTVKFGGVAGANTRAVGSTFLTSTVPDGALTGTVTVTTGTTTLKSSQIFRVTPTLSSFSPSSGPVGTPVQLTGTGLNQTTKVTFGGVAATTVTVNSDLQVTATVPTGARTGKVVITTKGGSVTSAINFTVN